VCDVCTIRIRDMHMCAMCVLRDDGAIRDMYTCACICATTRIHIMHTYVYICCIYGVYHVTTPHMWYAHMRVHMCDDAYTYATYICIHMIHIWYVLCDDNAYVVTTTRYVLRTRVRCVYYTHTWYAHVCDMGNESTRDTYDASMIRVCRCAYTYHGYVNIIL
jgi:hypothetical protein